MEKVLDFVEEQNYYTVPDRERRIACLKSLMAQSEKFHRAKAPPSFEYFAKNAIELGNEKIKAAHELFESFNLPVFKTEDFLRDPEKGQTKEKLDLKTSEDEVKDPESPEKNCDRDVRIGEKGEFGVFPFISFPGSGNT